MSLFPAYTSEGLEECPKDLKSVDSLELNVSERYIAEEYSENNLLKSSSSDEEDCAPPPPALSVSDPQSSLYYIDQKMDRANLHVSTLYYPAIPQYKTVTPVPLGGQRKAGERSRSHRYYRSAVPPTSSTPSSPEEVAQVAARAARMRAHLHHRPRDQDAWLLYIDHQLEWEGAAAALEAAEEAAARCHTRRVRDVLHAARLRHLPLSDVLDRLRRDATSSPATARRDAWLRLVEAGAGGGPDAAQTVAAAALAALSADPLAYPRVLGAHASWLAAAGLWERLTLLIELVAAMNFQPSSVFPPPRDPAAEDVLEAELLEKEEKVVNGGLPSNVVWTRVERLRAAVHWRTGVAGDADPQRYVAPADVAEMLRAAPPTARLALAAVLLRAAGVPALPASEHAARALPPGLPAPCDAQLVASMLRAARRLPPAHTPCSDGATARAILAPLLDPPHYFTDRTGFLRWVNALWEACCGWFAGRQRLALVCWRLRWLHMLTRLAEPEEARRLRGEARAVLRRLAPDAPVAFSHFARLECEVQGEAARRAALHAVRAALRVEGSPPEDALFCARVLAELSEPDAPSARWALCCAVLRRDLPSDEELTMPHPSEVLAATLTKVKERGEALEDGSEEEDEEEEETVEEALLPGAGEWAAALVALQDPGETRRALAEAVSRPTSRRRLALRYREAQASALMLAAARDARLGEAATALLPRFPSNALLALGSAGGSGARWVCGGAWRGSHAACVARALGARGGARRVWRECERAAPWGGAALAAWGCEAGAGAGRGAAALVGALAAWPHHKWLYVRCAALLPAECPRLVDALLERELRLHALPDELRPLEHTQHISP